MTLSRHGDMGLGGDLSLAAPVGMVSVTPLCGGWTGPAPRWPCAHLFPPPWTRDYPGVQYVISVSVGQCVPFRQSKDRGRDADEGGSDQLGGAIRRTDSLVLSVMPEAQAGQGQDPPLAPCVSIAGTLSPSHRAPREGRCVGHTGPQKGFAERGCTVSYWF